MYDTTAPLRVVQWATGNIGSRALRHVIEHPGMELAGVYVTPAGGKAGQDAADLCGLPARTGVTATSDIDAILASAPDCVLYMPAACDLDQVTAILAAGANIVTTRGEFHHPASMPPADRERVEAACARGGTSIHSTGSSPGFVSEALPIVLASVQRRLDLLTISEYADLSQRDSPDMLLGLMGFGQPPQTFAPGRFAYGAAAFGPSLRLTAGALGLPLDDVSSTGEVAVAAADTTIAAGTIKAGTVAAQRMTVTGTRNGKPLIRFVANWYCTDRLGEPWGVRETGWKITVDGDAPLDIDIRFPFALERMAEMTPGYTANRAVNAVACVCAAPPGIRTTVDLPQILARLGLPAGERRTERKP
jgi:4-hydroxy-tetrahydrodipicolinate reductase